MPDYPLAELAADRSLIRSMSGRWGLAGAVAACSPLSLRYWQAWPTRLTRSLAQSEQAVRALPAKTQRHRQAAQPARHARSPGSGLGASWAAICCLRRCRSRRLSRGQRDARARRRRRPWRRQIAAALPLGAICGRYEHDGCRRAYRRRCRSGNAPRGRDTRCVLAADLYEPDVGDRRQHRPCPGTGPARSATS